ncbi:MAG: hypothetical protein KF894_15175, partial [Labilithrix sp.]|nr:hypothetical protein [Labilithrix sp.]
MSRRLLFTLATLTSVAIASLASGCADERPAATGGGSSIPPAGGGARDGAASEPTDRDGGPTGDLCDPTAIEVDGEDVAEVVVRAE